MHEGRLEKTIFVLSDILANCAEWPVEDLREEVSKVAKLQDPPIEPSLALSIFDAYYQLPISTRLKPDLDRVAFVQSVLSSQFPDLVV